MKKWLKISLILLGCFGYAHVNGQVIYSFQGYKSLFEVIVTPQKDTVYSTTLAPFYCYPPIKFKSKAQEKFYWKTVRDVKKTLPYARIVSNTLNKANAELALMKSESEKKKYLKLLEKEVKERYEPDLRQMTFSQGKMLIRLIDRETNMTSYELIKMYRGSLSAFFWQGVAKIFGADLKQEYDGTDKDKIVERVITLVQAGQL